MAFQTLMPTTVITTAVTGLTTTPGATSDHVDGDVILLAAFVYGSGGTTAKAWVQTSFDGGVTWMDVANFAFTTASATKVSKLYAAQAVAANYTPTDGTLADNTVKDGLLGSLWRVKYTTTGTYAGGTSLTVSMQSR